MPTNTVIESYYKNYHFQFGRNPALSSAFETLWSGGGMFAGFKDTAVEVDVVSSDADDTMTTGAGAWKIVLEGLGEVSGISHMPLTEEIELNGVTPVTSTEKFNLVRKVKVTATADDDALTGPNHGAISITENGGSDVMAYVIATHGESMSAVDQVAANEYGEFVHWHMYHANIATAILQFGIMFQEPDTDSWNFFALNSVDAGSLIERDYTYPRLLLPKTKVQLVASISSGAIVGSASFEWKGIPFED